MFKPPLSPQRIVGSLVGVSILLYFMAMRMEASLAQFILKPLPVLGLALWVYLGEKTTYRKWLIAALLFSAVGDVMMEFANVGWGDQLVLGLSAFLITHVIYAAICLHHERKVMLIPLLMYGVVSLGLYGWMWPNLGEMALPVALYVIVITIMMWRTLALVERPLSRDLLAHSAWLGAIIFAVSDTLIATNRFVTPIANASVLIMISYWLAQLLIVKELKKL